MLEWEMFSFGEEPYKGMSFDEMLSSLNRGHRLPCPDAIQQIADWQVSSFYSKISRMCFKSNAHLRGTFDKIIDMIEMDITQEEFERYHEIATLETRQHSNDRIV